MITLSWVVPPSKNPLNDEESPRGTVVGGAEYSKAQFSPLASHPHH